jgi:hypothetical protein
MIENQPGRPEALCIRFNCDESGRRLNIENDRRLHCHYHTICVVVESDSNVLRRDYLQRTKGTVDAECESGREANSVVADPPQSSLTII